MIFGDWETVFPQGGDVTFDCFFDVGDGFLAGVSLADATRETRALPHPVTVYPVGDNNL